MTIKLDKPAYLVVYVSDMQRSLTFYRDKLGLSLKFESPGWSEFDTGTTTLALHRGVPNQPTELPERTPAGVAHPGFVVENLQAIYEELKAQAVPFSRPPQLQPSGVTLAVLHDPDGLGITLQQR